MKSEKIRVNVTFSKDMDAKIKKCADDVGVSKSQYIAMTVAKSVNQEEQMMQAVMDLVANAVKEEQQKK